ncbi:MAG TPA: right-handed parallel beta-helix repeat-containing protein [Candidatus Omnitrophota bacterium]|nr:right-handed parallel beta-helix repeat-containing protein [Candidatus Omnitrophota bacterium]HPT06852.1 right-handed parallel beta-helix repeat-containing protein [Candidatus Omnitrophota bacterium]
MTDLPNFDNFFKWIFWFRNLSKFRQISIIGIIFLGVLIIIIYSLSKPRVPLHIDTKQSGKIVIRNCISANNGRDGFKVSGENLELSGNQAIANGGVGFDIAGSRINMRDNVAFDNGDSGIKINDVDVK